MKLRLQPSTAVLLLAAVLLYCTGLGAIDLWAPDEPRYGQVAEELRSMQHGARGLVLLHLSGEPYTQKPPLYYWLAATGGWLTGGRVTEALARLPSALAGVGVVALCVAFGRALFGRAAAGRWAGAVLLSTWFFSHLARRAQLDVLLTLFESLALFGFWRIDSGATPRGRAAIAALHAAMGLAALTKGPVGWMPLAVFAAYLAWERRLGELRGYVPPWALALSVGPALAWVAVATWLGPEGYFDEAVTANILGRVVSADSHVRPPWYFLYQVPISFLPGTLLAPLVVARARGALRGDDEARRPWRFLLAWVAVPLVAFSLASGKRGLYMLPAFPALALACGAALDAWASRDAPWPRRASLGLLGLAAACAGLGAGFGPLTTAAAARGLAPPEGFAIPSDVALGVGGAIALGLGCAAVASRVARSRAAALALVFATCLAALLALFTSIYPRFDDAKSPRPIALAAARLTTEDEVIGIFDDEGLAGGLTYYGGRRAEILPRPPQVAAFLAGGGRLVVLERWKLPWLAEVGEFEIVASRRDGRRELAIVRRTAGATP